MTQQAGGEKAIIDPPAVGIYIHFPFCQRKCRYCDFYSEDTGLERCDQWLKALLTEIELRCQAPNRLPAIRTIYIGGGSPNLLPPAQLSMLVDSLHEHFDCRALGEFTLELNPNRITPALVRRMQSVGVNRVSLGFQSLQTNELQVLGRLHTVADCLAAFAKLQTQGFTNCSIDLIYGIPGQTMASWQATIRQVLELQPQHLSLYNLTYEEGTPLTNALHQGEILALDEELEWEMYAWAAAILAEAGFEHYEISNWAKPGFYSQHNLAYWHRQPYLGFGPSAHSFSGRQRSWNVNSIDQYLNLLAKGQLPLQGTELISDTKRDLEILMLALRTNRGIALEDLENICQDNADRIIAQLLDRLGEQLEMLITIDDRRLRLTTRGWFLYDALVKVFLDLIKEEDYGH